MTTIFSDVFKHIPNELAVIFKQIDKDIDDAKKKLRELNNVNGFYHTILTTLYMQIKNIVSLVGNSEINVKDELMILLEQIEENLEKHKRGLHG